MAREEIEEFCIDTFLPTNNPDEVRYRPIYVSTGVVVRTLLDYFDLELAWGNNTIFVRKKNATQT